MYNTYSFNNKCYTFRRSQFYARTYGMLPYESAIFVILRRVELRSSTISERNSSFFDNANTYSLHDMLELTETRSKN